MKFNLRYYLSASMLLVLFLPIPGLAADNKYLTFTTSDDVKVFAEFRSGPQLSEKRLIIVAPGFAQNHATRSMQALTYWLASTADVLVVDFRGTGESPGSFWFGAREYLDLEPVFNWAQPQYCDITLLGFSLGAYSGLRACVEFPGRVDRLLLVSCPTKVEDIILSGAAFLNPLVVAFRQTGFQIEPEDDIFFSWGPILSAKPSGAELAGKIQIPCHFLVGGQDTLVYESLSKKVYTAVEVSKSWLKIVNGVHAEQMFLQDPDFFMLWVNAKIYLEYGVEKPGLITPEFPLSP